MKKWDDIRKPPRDLVDESCDPDQNYYKEYSEIGDDTESHFLIIEVAGDADKARDLRYTIEKLEYTGIGMTGIVALEDMARMVGWPGPSLH